ncbi:hypothetical protein CUMW_258250 [Citrus unshiu]|uniref:Uncharacterized protein n=1 Tax=Citrus unshiu TaxID=55188 RepID=A0A2H5QSQ6_CITUN|nr:hypothetical protein CUMW_258250 [Citrus unshiu]
MINESLDNALYEKYEKFKTTRLENPDHNIEKYNLYSFMSGVQAWIYEAIGGLPSVWVVKTKKKIPRIVLNLWQCDVLQTLEPNAKESSRKYWLIVKDYMPCIPDWVHKHQPVINAPPSVTTQSDEHDNIPNPTTEQRHDTSEDEVAVDDHQEQTDNSDETHDSELDKIDRNVYKLKSEFKDFKETVVGFIYSMSKSTNNDSPTGHSYAAKDDYGMYTDVGNQNFSTPTSLYSFYGDVSGESVQVFTEAPLGISKFDRAY